MICVSTRVIMSASRIHQVREVVPEYQTRRRWYIQDNEAGRPQHNFCLEFSGASSTESHYARPRPACPWQITHCTQRIEQRLHDHTFWHRVRGEGHGATDYKTSIFAVTEIVLRTDEVLVSIAKLGTDWCMLRTILGGTAHKLNKRLLYSHDISCKHRSFADQGTISGIFLGGAQ